MLKLKVTAQNADYELSKIKAAAQQQDLTVEIRPYKKSRSLSQNALYWVWLGEISKKMRSPKGAFSAEVWHEYFKKYFCPTKLKQMPAGEPASIKSTTALDKGEMQHYMNRVYEWSIDKGLFLSIPLTSEYQKLQEKQNE